MGEGALTSHQRSISTVCTLHEIIQQHWHFEIKEVDQKGQGQVIIRYVNETELDFPTLRRWEYSVVTIIGKICFVCCVDWGMLKYRFLISAETPVTLVNSVSQHMFVLRIYQGPLYGKLLLLGAVQKLCKADFCHF